MTIAQLAPAPLFQGITATGAPLVGGKLFTYAAGTNTPQVTYIDSTQTTTNTNPIILNAYGQASVWLNPGLAYKFVLQDSAGNQLYSVDNILGALSQPNVVIGPPAAGTALATFAAPGNAAITASGGPILITNSGAPLLGFNNIGAGFSLIQNDSALNWSIAYTASNTPTVLGTPLLQWNSSGNFVIQPATSGAGLLVNSSATGGTAIVAVGSGSTNPVVAITNINVAGQSSGLLIDAGVSAADLVINVNSASNTTLMTLNGIGAMTVGGVAAQTTGSVNCSGGFYVNNVRQPIFAAPLAGWGTPSSPAPVSGFSGSAATLVQCSTAIAQIIATLKAAGIYAA